MKPALTAEEWAKKCFTRKIPFTHTSKRTYDYELEITDGGSIGIMDDSRWIVLEKGTEHAMAALCLHAQPFGFTRADVVVLRGAQSALNFECLDRGLPRPCTLADRIEALLPPEA